MTAFADSLRAKAQGVTRCRDGKVRWCIWAPNHSSVKLVLANEENRRRVLEMTAEEHRYFGLELPEIVVGARYGYQLGDAAQILPDPASRWQPDGVHHPSAAFFPEDFDWHDDAWPGLSASTLVIYELHIGTFTREGTFSAAISRLASLKELGITAIEIMPVAQFPGTRNWGYDGVHLYAAQNSYGGPWGLMQLVDAAHQTGLGVILDVVYNHLGPEGNYLSQFGPYFAGRHQTPWGAAWNFDGPDSDPVRQYVIDNACRWIREFHIDGLRLDAVQTIFDHSAYHLIAELQEEVQQTAAACGRTAIVIAETNQNDARITAETNRGGYGLNGVWSDDFHHCVHALLTGEREGYYSDFGSLAQLAKAYRDVFVYDGCYSAYGRHRHGSRVTDQPHERFVVCIQNHDQIGNRPRGNRLGTLLTPAAQRLAAALLLIAPQTPMLFMGEEYGETNPFPFFCSFGDPHLTISVREGRQREFAKQAFHWLGPIPDATALQTFEAALLSWKWENDLHRSGLRRLYQTLLIARQTWPALIDRENCQATVVEEIASQPVLAVERGVRPNLLVMANLSAERTKLPTELIGDRTPLLSTAEHRFGGERTSLDAITEFTAHEMILWGDAAWT